MHEIKCTTAQCRSHMKCCSLTVFFFFWVCSELQTEALRWQSFEQKCESWMSFLQRMEDSLAVDVAGSYVGLRQQQCTHKVSYMINRLTTNQNTTNTQRCNPDLSWFSAVSGRAVHWSPDPSFSYHWSSSSAAERRGGGQVGTSNCKATHFSKIKRVRYTQLLFHIGRWAFTRIFIPFLFFSEASNVALCSLQRLFLMTLVILCLAVLGSTVTTLIFISVFQLENI